MRETYEDNHRDPGRRWQFKRLDTGIVQNQKAGPQQEHIKEADKTKEDRHTDPALITNAFFHQHGIDAIQDSRKQGHCVAQSNLSRRLVREQTAAIVVVAKEVDRGDEDNAQQRGKDAKEFAQSKDLDTDSAAQQQGEDATRRGEDGRRGDGRVLQTGGDKVVGQEPEHAELKTQTRRFAQG